MIGRTIGHYRVIDRLGGGGMGVVYRAEDVKLGRQVALKFLPPEVSRDPEAKSRFEREARAASLLDHPNICTIYDFGEADGEQLYIAMACYDGESLAARVARERLSLDEAIRIVEQIARGLDKAHASGVVHRDIKPANVMLTRDGVAKILDFGLAKLTGATGITRDHTSLGTIAYMAPEQIRGEQVGPQADIWALGVVLFELLTGSRPFRGEYSEAISYSILNEQPAAIPDQPEADRIVKRMLRKDPLQRYQTIAEVLADLEPLKTPSSGSSAKKRVAAGRQLLRSGAKLGPYQIVKPVGSGGMGDVYLASDTRLDRQVALKVLPSEFSEDAERKERFQREAKTISQLAHPNICTLFDIGEQEGVDYLVMEYLEGETLAEKKKPLPIPLALKIGAQIAEGLAAAHRQGIVHRDLKPGNVIITKMGAVKLLDFGLAKDVVAIAIRTRGSDEKPLTAEGMIVGTLAYMAPEQIEGLEVDARTDIFALGTILYELVTGKRAFEGETKASLMAAILERDPASVSGVEPRVPPIVDHIIRRCLAKEPEERWQSARDVANEIGWVAQQGSETLAISPDATRRRKLVLALPWVVASLLGMALIFVGLNAIRSRSADGESVYYRFEVPATTKHYRSSWLLSVSPDGRHFIASAVGEDGKRRLFRRGPGDAEMTPIAGTENVGTPTFSPDSQQMFFGAGKNIQAMTLAGGSPVDLGRKPPRFDDGYGWRVNGERQFLYDDGIVIQSVQLPGGKPAPVTRLDTGSGEVSHRYPWFLPDGDRFLFLARSRAKSGEETNTIYLARLGSTERKPLLQASSRTIFADPGYLLFARGHTLLAVPFDLKSEKITGPETALVDDLNANGETGRAAFTVSNDGVLTYRQRTDRSRFAWFDRAGKEVPAKARTGIFLWWSLSPDGRNLAAAVTDDTNGKSDIWLYGVDRETSSRVTFEPVSEDGPVWIDDRRIAYQHWLDERHSEIRITSVDEPGEPQTVVGGDGSRFPTAYVASSKMLLYAERREDRGEIWQIALEPGAKPEPLVRAPYSVSEGNVSPDGRWLLYRSTESGQWELHVRPYGRSGARLQVSTVGVEAAIWSRDGNEILFKEGVNVYSIPVSARGDRLELGERQLVFTRADASGLDQLPDGRFAMKLPVDDRYPPNVVITNWLALLKEKSGERR
ncbi:MAG TPA: protein kinase [Thermoanaerobaculia bacterium]